MTKFVWQSCQTVGNETRPKTRLVIEGHEGAHDSGAHWSEWNDPGGYAAKGPLRHAVLAGATLWKSPYLHIMHQSG